MNQDYAQSTLLPIKRGVKIEAESPKKYSEVYMGFCSRRNGDEREGTNEVSSVLRIKKDKLGC